MGYKLTPKGTDVKNAGDKVWEKLTPMVKEPVVREIDA